MSRFGRRTFLATSAGVAAGATLGSASTWPFVTPDAAERRGDPAAAAGRRAHRERHGGPRGRRPGRLLVRLDSAGRWSFGQADRLSHRGPPDRPGTGRARLGQRPGRLGTAGLRRLRGSPPRRRRGLRVDGPAEWAGGAVGAGVGAGPVHHCAAAGRLAGPMAASGWLLPTARPRHLPADRGHTPGGRRPPGHRLPLCGAHLPALRRRRRTGCVAQLLLPRRAVRPDRGPDRRPFRGAAQRGRRAAPVVRGGQGQAGVGPRTARPALAVVRRRPPHRVRVRRDLDGAPGRVAALAAAQLGRVRLRRVGGRARPPERMGRGGLRRPCVDPRHRDRAGGHGALHPHLPAADQDRRAHRRAGDGAHVAHRLRRGRLRRRVRGPATSHVPLRAGRVDCPDARGLPAGPRRRGLDDARDPGDEPVLLLRDEGRVADVRGLLVPRLPLPPDRRPRRGNRSRAGGRARPSRRHARRPDGDLRHGRSGFGRRVEAQRALMPLLLPRAVRRHTDTGEGAIPLGRGERVRGGDADLRRAEPELAGVARRSPGPGSLLARRPGQRGVPLRLRGAGHPDVHRALSRVGVALLRLHRRQGHGGDALPDDRPRRRLPLGHAASGHGAALRAGRRARG